MLQRLQKIIAQAGIASRRHAEELIRSGQVRVNGAIVTELGSKADPDRDRVEVAGRVAEVPEERVYILLNKPPEVVSTLADPEGRKTLRHFLRGTPERVFPVGRLDYAASGLVLLTSDGDLAARVFHAAARLRQIYWIKVKGRISETEMHDVGRAASAHFAPLKGPWAKRSAANPWYEVELTGASRDALGRSLKRQDHPIEKMKRVQLGTLELGLLPEGHYRRLGPAEIDKFSRAVDRSLAGKNEPAAIAPTHQSLAAPPRLTAPFVRPDAAAEQATAPPTARPPLATPINRPQFAAPSKPWHGAPSRRPTSRPREPWRARSGNPPPRNKTGTAPQSSNHPRPGAPHHGPGAPAKQDWHAQKSGPWRGNKTGGAPRSQNHPRPGAPHHRPGAPAKQDWHAQKSGPWRGNKTGSAQAPPKKPWPGAPHHRPGASAKSEWRPKKTGPWRGDKSGGPPRSRNRPQQSARPRNQGSAQPPHRPTRPDRPDRDPRHTPRHSR